MTEQIAQIILFIAAAYLAIGLIFSVFFYLKGMSKIDAITAESTWGFKLIVFPGVIAFWPFLLSKWRKNR
ncbi:MAG: hypothetical protein AB8F95_09640 [Bacteroidia bacterium]